MTRAWRRFSSRFGGGEESRRAIEQKKREESEPQMKMINTDENTKN